MKFEQNICWMGYLCGSIGCLKAVQQDTKLIIGQTSRYKNGKLLKKIFSQNSILSIFTNLY